MCDHCRTYKPMLEEGPRYYETERPRIQEQTRAGASDGGCCSWRQSCCNGGCCSQLPSCCSAGPEVAGRPYEKAPPAYGYGYGRTGIKTSSPGIPIGNAVSGLPDKVPCTRQEKKLPMCFGGDCMDSSENLSEKDGQKCENDVSQSTPRQSER